MESRNHISKTCSAIFKRKEYLKIHTSSVHEGKKPFQCTIYKKKSSRKTSLDMHVASIHEDKREYACPDCKLNSKWFH